LVTRVCKNTRVRARTHVYQDAHAHPNVQPHMLTKVFLVTRVSRVCNKRVPRCPRPPKCPTAHAHKSVLCSLECTRAHAYQSAHAHPSAQSPCKEWPGPPPICTVLFAISGLLIIVHKKRQESHHAADCAVVFFLWSAGAVIDEKGDISKVGVTSNNCFDNCFNLTLRACQMRPHCFEMHFLFLHSNQRQAHLKQRCVQGFQSVYR
jgi:hypothetical protein